MAALKILLLVLGIAVMFFCVIRKMRPGPTMLMLGFAYLLIAAITTGTSALGDAGVGNHFLDIFALAASKFKSQASGTGMIIMTTFGYVAYLNHIKATQMLTCIASKPLRKLKSPYFAVALAFLIFGFGVKMFIVSHSGLTALLMATIYPCLLAAGCSKTTAACACVFCGPWEWAAGEPITNVVYQLEEVNSKVSLVEFWLKYQMKVMPIIMAITWITFILVNMYCDKKEKANGTFETEAVEAMSADSLGVPKWYALFPLVPMVMLVIFSDLVTGIVIDVNTANILGFTIVFIINLLVTASRKGKEEGLLLAAFNDGHEFFAGCGHGFATTVGLICAAAVFNAGLSATGGTQALLAMAAETNLNGWVALAIPAFLSFFIAFATGSGVASAGATVPLVPDICNAVGINVLYGVLPTNFASGPGRCICAVTAAMIIASGGSGVNVVKLVRRNIIPSIVSFLACLIIPALVFG